MRLARETSIYMCMASKLVRLTGSNESFEVRFAKVVEFQCTFATRASSIPRKQSRIALCIQSLEPYIIRRDQITSTQLAVDVTPRLNSPSPQAVTVAAPVDETVVLLAGAQLGGTVSSSM